MRTFGGYSPNPHKIVKIVLANGVVSEIDAARVFRHCGLGGNVFGGLILVSVEVIVGAMIAEKSHDLIDMFACLIS